MIETFTAAPGSPNHPLMIAIVTYIRPVLSKAFSAFFIWALFAAAGYAQQSGIPDSLRTGQAGGQGQAQASQPSAPEQEGQVNFQATDSLVFNFKKNRIATLYGSAKVNHQAGELSSGKVALNLDSSLVSAATQTPQDTLSQPVLLRDSDRIRSERISFNYKTEKGRFEVARVAVDQGYLTGTKVKNQSKHVVFLEDAIYSTCNLDHPHYYIKADRMKVVNQEKVFFTNARLYILDIPYPIVFPFGYLPGKIDQKQSGLLQPTYVSQNQATRGIGVQNLGWFQYFNDYLVGQASVDIFTSGTFFLDGSTRYSNRNNYNGSIQVGYSRERGLEPTDPNFTINTQKRISVSHNQDFSPYANMSANINLRTADFNRRNSFDIDERAEVSTSSSISYRYRHPENIYNFSVSARQNQNFNNNTTRLSGPDANFSLKQFSPFSSDRPGSEQAAWYENISIRYQNSFQSDFSYQPIAADSAQINWFEALLDPSKYREATGDNDHYKYGFRQQADISFGNLLPSRFVNLSASGDYTEYWYPTSIRKSFNDETNQVETRQVRGFEAAREFSAGLSMSTTVYGIVNGKIGNIEGFRHTFRPSLSFSYSPDFGSDFWGYYRDVQTDLLGNTRTYSIYENEVFTGPRRGEQRVLSLNISNVFEAKQVRRDSTGEKKENILRLIDQLDFNTSYNFAADSLNLSDLNASFSSRIIQGINIRANAQFNFYERDSLGTKIDDFLITDSRQLAEMTNFSVSASYNFNSQGGTPVNDNYYFPASYDPYDQSIFHEMDSNFNSRPVQNTSSPFSVSFNFRYSWRLNTRPDGENTKSATLNARNIRFQLTPKWSFQTQLGYDFIEKELTPSQFSLSRSLHMWNLSFQMSPFGDFQYYAFALRLNSAQIQSIFQKLPLLNNLERSSSPSGRRPPGF